MWLIERFHLIGVVFLQDVCVCVYVWVTRLRTVEGKKPKPIPIIKEKKRLESFEYGRHPVCGSNKNVINKNLKNYTFCGRHISNRAQYNRRTRLTFIAADRHYIME